MSAPGNEGEGATASERGSWKRFRQLEADLDRTDTETCEQEGHPLLSCALLEWEILGRPYCRYALRYPTEASPWDIEEEEDQMDVYPPSATPSCEEGTVIAFPPSPPPEEERGAVVQSNVVISKYWTLFQDRERELGGKVRKQEGLHPLFSLFSEWRLFPGLAPQKTLTDYWRRFRQQEVKLTAKEREEESLHPLSLALLEWQLFGSLYCRKALNLHQALQRGVIPTELLFDSLPTNMLHQFQDLDGNLTGPEEEKESIAICGNKVIIYKDGQVPCMRMVSLADNSSEEWVLPGSLYGEDVMGVVPSHNENFFILMTTKNTYLGDIREKKFECVHFEWEGRTPLSPSSPLVKISPLPVPKCVWEVERDLLNYQPFIASIIHSSVRRDAAGNYIFGEIDTHMSSRIFFTPLVPGVPRKEQLEYLHYFTRGVMGNGGKPACLRNELEYTVNIGEVGKRPEIVREIPGERSFPSNVSPYSVYFWHSRATGMQVPKVRIVGGWHATEQYHLLTESEGKALRTDVNAFIPDPEHPLHLLAYATDLARVSWHIPEMTENRRVSEVLVTLLNSLQQQHGVDFRPLPTSSQDPHTLVFLGQSDDSSKFLIVNPFQESPKTTLIDCGIPSPYDSLLANQYPRREAFSIEASDGTPLYGYVTHPVHQLPHRPGILLIHGGPACRDTWSSGGHMFYARRRYTVFSLNYRGSEGYGREFQDSLYKKYGSVDLEDNMRAIQYAVEKGWVNPDYIGVQGASYGAYAAVRMAERFPESIRCVIAENGVFDLAKLLEGERQSVLNMGLDPLFREDRARLEAQSARADVNRIKAPCLIMHGDKDTVCLIEQSVALVQEMKEQGKEVCFVYVEGGEHTLTDLPSLRATLLCQELFLERTLGGFAVLPTDEFKNAPGVEILEGRELLGLGEER